MKKVFVVLVLLAMSSLWSACGSAGSATDGAGAGPSGSVRVALNGASAGALASIAIQNVFDTDQRFLIDCREKAHTLYGTTFCDELIVLPPGVYEVIVQSADPDCRTAQDHYKVVVKPDVTTELQIDLVCGVDNGALDTVVREDHLPVVADVGFSFENGGTANKFICADDGPVTITATLDDVDTACTDLLVDWTAMAGEDGATLVFVPGSEVQPHTDPATGACIASITVDPTASSLGDFDLTLEIFDDGPNDAHTTTFTFPIHVIEDCFPGQTSTLVPGWDIFTLPGTGHVDWSISPNGTLQVTFVLQGSLPNVSFTGGAHFLNPSNLLADPNVTSFGPGATFVGSSLATREGTTAFTDAFDFGPITTDASGNASTTFVLMPPPGTYNLQWSVRAPHTTSVAFRSPAPWALVSHQLVIP